MSPLLEDTVYLTSATENGKQRVVIAVERTTRDIRWQTIVWEGEAEDTHAMNNRASSTCDTDGESVIAFFGKGGLHSLDAKTGKLSERIWKFEGPAQCLSGYC